VSTDTNSAQRARAFELTRRVPGVEAVEDQMK
jgi:osmotically-inducible protein OsmY